MKYLKTICFTAFFLSGLASIVYELTWIRLLRNIIGSDSLAFSSLLTIFISGIASGTFISGKLIKKYFSAPEGASDELLEKIHKAKSFFSIIVYGLIELTVGLYALATPFLLSEDSLGSIWTNLNILLSDNMVILSLAKFFIAGLVLILPTLLLGLSYPLLVELVTSNEAKTSSKYKLGSSNLYATNTLGSIFGSIIGGFVLIPSFGLKTSILIATLINFFIAFIVYLLNHNNQELFKGLKIKETLELIVKNAHEVKLQAQEQIKKGAQFWILVITGVILGFSNLGLEVIWNKIFALIIGSSVFSATIVISVVLAGISFGAYSLNYFTDKIDDENLAPFLTLNISLFAFAIFLSTVFLNSCPWFFLEVNKLLTELFGEQSWFFVNLTKYITVSSIIFPVTFLEGLAYAIVLYKASEISKAKNDPVGSRIAIISYWNTIGAIAGSFSAGFILIPFFSQFGSGISNSIRMILVLAFITAILSLFIDTKLNRKLCLILLIVATGVTAFFLPSLAKNTLNSGTEIYKSTKFKNISKKNFNKENESILFYKEGLNSVVTVVEDRAANAIFLKNNGKIEAGIPIQDSYPSKADTVTQTLLGILPIALNSDAKNALVVGMGSGKTVESLAIAGKENKLKDITVCELEKEVFQAAQKFFVKDFPVKVKKKNIDARVYLNTTKEYFDIIASQPSDPWMSGSLFTKEFWHKAKDKLSDDGVFIQWLQLYSLDKEHLEIALRTFKDVFPEAYIFRPPHSAELLLVGSNTLNFFDINKVESVVNNSKTRKNLLRIGITNTEELLATMILLSKDLNRIPASKSTKEQIFSTDDNMSLELHTSKKIDSFNESIEGNLNYLNSLSLTDNLYKFFSSFEEFNFLTKLAAAHKDLRGPIHQKLAKELAEKMHHEHKSPLSYLTLYEQYQQDLEFEKAESILYEASRDYQDSVAQIKNQSIVFEDLHHSFHKDFDQNLALYKIFLRYEDFKSARNLQRLLKKQILKEDREQRKIYQAEIFYEKSQAQLASLQEKVDFKDIARIKENIKRARREDPINYKYLKAEALLNLKIADLKPEQGYQYRELAKYNFEDLNKLYPLDYESHLNLAEIIYQRLPKSQMKYMAKRGDDEFEENLKQCLVYLKNALELNALSYRANFYMADLQYKLGNLDLSHRHLKRLETLCKDQGKCLDELGNENKVAFEELLEKINNITKTGA